MVSQRSIWNLQTGRSVLLCLCAVALENSLVPPASGQSVESSSIGHVKIAAAEANRQDGESMLVSGQIRSALWSDPSLSAPAKRIDILASPQAIVLRGAVAPGETSHIEALAREYAGARQIENHLTVASVAPRRY
jgi:hypothetical protein